MERAKLFKNGRSQAVRLPKSFRFEGDEVFIKKTSTGVLLISKAGSVWDIWEERLTAFDEPFVTDRCQPKDHQVRGSLDDLFT